MALQASAFELRVEDVMTEKVYTVDRDASLMDARNLLRKHNLTGLPVVKTSSSSDDDDTEKRVVVGMLSRKDLRPYWQRSKNNVGTLEKTPVRSVMKAPAVLVREKAHLGEAAALMLAHEVYRLPVVRADGTLVGIIARPDVFTPMLPPGDASLPMLMRKAEVNGARPSVDLDDDALLSLASFDDSDDGGNLVAVEPTWKLKYLYDGDCSLCRMLKDALSRGDERTNPPGAQAICFVNIADLDYDPGLNKDIEYKTAMETIHAIRADGTVLTGTTALEALYEAAGMGFVTTLMRLPIASAVAGLVYNTMSALRIPLDGRSWDALLAARRMKSTATANEEEWQCTSEEDEEDCAVPEEW